MYHFREYLVGATSWSRPGGRNQRYESWRMPKAHSSLGIHRLQKKGAFSRQKQLNLLMRVYLLELVLFTQSDNMC